MRIRFGSFLAASVLALTGALTVLPGTALMATQTQVIGEFNDGAGTVEYTYDDVTHKVQQLIVINTGLKEDLTMSMYQCGDNTPIRSWSGAAKSGTTTFNVPQSGANSVTLILTSKGYWILPFCYGIMD